MSVFSAPSFDHHELVAFGSDRATGLRAIVAVHDSTLGTAVGGCRMFPYADDAAALEDVLRLSRGMTLKSALADLPLGGGKSVIIGNPHTDKTPALLRAMGDFIDSLNGHYVAAEDSGTSVADLRLIGSRTAHVSGVTGNAAGGDPSPSTALGVFLGLREAVAYRTGSYEMVGLKVAIQGLGHVGYHLARHLIDAGALVIAADVNTGNAERAQRELGVHLVAPEDILAQVVDVIAPCAMGAVLTEAVVDTLRAGIIAGAANNQLATAGQDQQLRDRGILYCPDFLINAGGIIDVHYQRRHGSEQDTLVHVRRIPVTLRTVLERADREGRCPGEVAEALAGERLRRGATLSPAARVIGLQGAA